MLDGKDREAKEDKSRGIDHDSVAGPISFEGGEGGMSFDSHHGQDSVARARYSFQGEVRCAWDTLPLRIGLTFLFPQHVGELSVSAGEDLVILEASDANWFVPPSFLPSRSPSPS